MGVERIHQFFHVLHGVAVRDHQCILGFYHDQIFHPEQGYQLAVAMHIATAAVVADDIALEHISIGVLVVHIP
ncbi:hypothetical protein D9M69_665940 [compost metagenome]